MSWSDDLLTLAGSLYFPALYVLPLYFLGPLPRNHPKTIWRRIAASTVVTCALAWVPTWLALPPGVRARHGFLPLLGLRTEGIATATVLPLALTATLFAGPLYTLYLDAREGTPLSAKLPTGPAALRNLVAAPLTEELAFRSCLVSFLLARGVGRAACVFLSPLAFGAAHLHHLFDLVRHQGYPLGQAAAAVIFQLGYTTLFGWFAAYLLLRMGSLPALVLVHAFCNFMGFPALGAIPSYPHPRRVALAYVAGIAAFAGLLRLLTDPALYWPRGWGGDYTSLFSP